MAMPTADRPVLPIVLLQHMADELEVPEGFRVEILGEELVVSPAPLGPHAYLVALVRDALAPLLPRGAVSVENVSLEVTATGERYIPDLLVYPARGLRQEGRWLFPAEDAFLVVEVTSPSNAANDRVRKLRGYARAHVPLYLLVEPEEESATLFCDPVDGAYRAHSTVPYGAALALPSPFTGKLSLAWDE
ncbi:MAG: Uma2 family endonuclease [Nocardiopsaceae bacterium]|nr:Uma2 family endonuclease [Nocardiopsaceae bacterium]